MPGYLFYIFDSSETITSMETAPRSVAVVYVPSTSVSRFQNLLRILPELSLILLSTSPLPQIPRMYSIKKNKNTRFFITEEANVEE